MLYTQVTLITVLFFSFSAAAQKSQLIFTDYFNKKTLDSNWIVENAPVKGSSISIQKGKLVLDTENGVTVWYKHKIKGNFEIEYIRTIVMDSGRNDRLSDLNQFWMATDPQQKMFTRKGGFKEYDSLQMYYVGMGGNYNTTTRMRRYNGKGALKITGEFTDSTHLLKPNTPYRIKLSFTNGTSKFFVNDILFFEFTDSNPFTEGWFAIRSTKSRQVIDDVKIWTTSK
jgi:rhamnogalacturonan endolyase